MGKLEKGGQKKKLQSYLWERSRPDGEGKQCPDLCLPGEKGVIGELSKKRGVYFAERKASTPRAKKYIRGKGLSKELDKRKLWEEEKEAFKGGRLRTIRGFELVKQHPSP